MACCTSSRNSGSRELGACDRSEFVSFALTVLSDSNCDGSNVLTLDVGAASAGFAGFDELKPHSERLRVCCARCIGDLEGNERNLEDMGALKSECDEY